MCTVLDTRYLKVHYDDKKDLYFDNNNIPYYTGY